MMTWTQRLIFCALLGVSLSLSGCLVVAAAGAAAGGVAYVSGDLEGTLSANPPQAIAAVERAVEGLGLAKVSSASTDLDGQVVARTAQDKKVTIGVKKTSDGVSSVSIRIGTFGDEAMSVQIYERIKSEL